MRRKKGSRGEREKKKRGQSPRRATRRKVLPCILFLFLFLLLEGRPKKGKRKRDFLLAVVYTYHILSKSSSTSSSSYSLILIKRTGEISAQLIQRRVEQ